VKEIIYIRQDNLHTMPRETPCKQPENEFEEEKCLLCPIKAEGKRCWEFDWVKYVKNITNPMILEAWRDYIREHCLNCNVYEEHRDVMEPMFTEIGAIIVPKEVEIKEEKHGIDIYVPTQGGQ
jgi:hypothetical protein